MAGDALAKVTPGQPLRIPAAAYNAFVDAAVDLRMRQQRGGGAESAGRRRESGLVLLRNDSGGDLDRFAIVTLSGVAISPAENLNEFQAAPIFTATAPVAGSPVAVLQEPIADGKYGQAMVSGVTPCLVTVNDAGHQYCEATAGVTDALSSVALGSIRILWSDAGSGSGSGSGSGAENQWSVVALGPAAALGVDTTQVDLEPELQILSGELQVRAKKPYLDIEDGKAKVKAGDYGAWSGVASLNLTDAGGFATFCVQANEDSYDALLDASIDWRDRIIESSIATVSATPSNPTEDSRYSGWPGTSENLVTDGNYQLYVASNGNLRVSAATWTVTGRTIWVKASGRCRAPCSCPCGEWYQGEWPCGGLNQTYQLDVTLRIRQYDTAAREEPPLCDTTVTISNTVTAQLACGWSMGAQQYKEYCDRTVWFSWLTNGPMLDYDACRWQIFIGLGVGGGAGTHAYKVTGNTPVGIYEPEDAESAYVWGSDYVVVEYVKIEVS